MLSDVTPFSSGFGGASQSPAIAQAFAHAALDPAGACKQPAAGVVDLAVSLTGPASLTPGTPASSWLRVANPDVVARTAPTVTVTLPPGVTAVGTPPVGCTFSSANTIVTCQLPDRSVAGSSNLSIQLVAAAGGAGGATPSRRCRPRPAKSTQPTTMRLWRSPLAPRRLHRPPCQRWMSGRCLRWAACCRWWLRAAVGRADARLPVRGGAQAARAPARLQPCSKLSATASPTLMPSMPADRMPPA